MNRIFILLCFGIFLSSLATIMVNAKQPKNMVQITDFYMDLWYDKNPTLSRSTYIDFEVGYYGGAITITTLELTIANSTDTLLLFSNPSNIYLDDTNPYYYDYVELQFDKIEIWDITLFVETEAGDPFYEYGQLEVSPFRLGLYSMCDPYVNKSTEINYEVEYYDNIPNKNITIEVLLDDSMENYPGTNVSIYNSLYTFTIAPDSYYNSFYNVFDSSGYYKLWLNVTDLDTNKQWFTWDYTDVEWINISISQEYQVFVDNTTMLEVELNSYLSISINVDAVLTIRRYYPEYPKLEYSYQWTNIQLDPTNPQYYNSISLTFQEHGEFDVELVVIDQDNDEYIYDGCYYEVYNEVDLRIYQPMEIWTGDDYWANLDILYFKSTTVTANIEFLIDDGISSKILYSAYDVTFFGQTPYSFNYHYWGNSVNDPINQMGYFDVYLRVYIQETMEEYVEYCWFYVRGGDTSPPEIIDTSGLNDGDTYSDIMTITANVTDDQSDVYNVILDVTNENFSETFFFNTEIDWYKYKTYCHCYATLTLNTANIYDGDYKVTIEAEDDQGYRASETFSVRFENEYIYEPPKDDEDDKISPGFEGYGLIFALIVVVNLIKRRK